MAEKGAYLDGRRQHIAYADDFDPRLPENEDWYENASLEVGYDDFGEFLGRDFWGTFINQVLHKGCDVFIEVSEPKSVPAISSLNGKHTKPEHCSVLNLPS